jgi:hypothetical protein
MKVQPDYGGAWLEWGQRVERIATEMLRRERQARQSELRSVLDATAAHLGELRAEHAAKIERLRAEVAGLRSQLDTVRRLDELAQRLDRLEGSPRPAAGTPPLRAV